MTDDRYREGDEVLVTLSSGKEIVCTVASDQGGTIFVRHDDPELPKQHGGPSVYGVPRHSVKRVGADVPDVFTDFLDTLGE